MNRAESEEQVQPSNSLIDDQIPSFSQISVVKNSSSEEEQKKPYSNSKSSLSSSFHREAEQINNMISKEQTHNNHQEMQNAGNNRNRINVLPGKYHIKQRVKIREDLAGEKEGKVEGEQIDENVLNQINQDALQRAQEISLKERIYQDVIDNSKPLWITKINVRFYWLVVLIVVLVQVVSIILTLKFSLLSTAYPTKRDLFIWKDIRTLRYDVETAVQDAISAQTIKVITNNQVLTERQRPAEDYSIQIIFKCKRCKTLYTESLIKEMYAFTQKILDHPHWNKLCYLSNGWNTTDKRNCPSSAYSNRTSFLVPYLMANNLTDEIAQQLFNEKLGSAGNYYNNRKYFSTSYGPNNPYTTLEMAYLYTGYPFYIKGELYGIENGAGFLLELSQFVYDLANNYESDTLEILAASNSVLNDVLNSSVSNDMILALGCCAFIWLYVAIHVRSLFISTMAMLNILLAIPVALTLYKLVFQVPYFSIIHILVFLIILGIGADNVFLFNDTWDHTRTIKALQNDYNKRAAYSFRKATRAIIATSITNFVAFMGTIFSQVMPISAFGVFSTTIIALVYMMIIFIMPSYYILYERHIEKRFTCFDRLAIVIKNLVKKIFKRKVQSKQEPSQNQVPVDIENLDPQNVDANIKVEKDRPNNIPALKQINSEANEPLSKNCDTPPKDQQQNLNDQEQQRNNHEPISSEDILIESQRIQQEENKEDSQQRSGKKEIVAAEYKEISKIDNEIVYEDFMQGKMSAIDKFFDKYFSKAIFKGRIVITILAVVWFAISLWKALSINPVQGDEKYLIESHPLQKMLDIMSGEVWNEDHVIKVNFNWGVDQQLDISRISKWNTSYLGDIIWDNDFTISPPANQKNLYNFCQQLKTFAYTAKDPITNEPLISCPINDFKKWVEGKGQTFPVDEAYFQANFTRFVLQDNAGQNQVLGQNIFIYNGYLKFIRVNVQSIGNTMMSAAEKELIYQEWESLKEKINLISPQGMKNCFQSAYDKWPYTVLQSAFFQNAIQGLVLSLVFAFCVLIFTTHNIIISAFSVLTIACALSSVICIMQLMGWTLGISESLGIDLFVGFSVDYIVHVGHAYVETIYDSRKQRMDHTYQNIGIAVFSGAVTTFISATFLDFANINVLKKFGILIQLTVSFSVIFALIAMPALLYLLGPQFKQGDLKHYVWDPIIKRCSKQQKKIEEQKQTTPIKQKDPKVVNKKPQFENNEDDFLNDDNNDEYDEEEYEEGEEGEEGDEDYDDDEYYNERLNSSRQLNESHLPPMVQSIAASHKVIFPPIQNQPKELKND